MMDSVKEEQSNHQQQQAAATRRRPPRTAAKRKSATASDIRDEDAAKRKKTFDDFFNFCNFVLAYEEQLANSEPLTATTNGTNSAGESSHSTSPTHTSSSSSNSSDSSDDSISVGEGEEAPHTPSSTETVNERLEYTSDDESWNLVTCFCRRPFAGRPMIECNQCSTWVHLFCAKIKKEHVPEVYTCPKCRASNTRKAKRKRVKVIKSVDKET